MPTRVINTFLKCLFFTIFEIFKPGFIIWQRKRPHILSVSKKWGCFDAWCWFERLLQTVVFDVFDIEYARAWKYTHKSKFKKEEDFLTRNCNSYVYYVHLLRMTSTQPKFQHFGMEQHVYLYLFYSTLKNKINLETLTLPYIQVN